MREKIRSSRRLIVKVGSALVTRNGTGLDKVPDTYPRYLEGWFRDRFSLMGTPLRIEYRSAANPYADRG